MESSGQLQQPPSVDAGSGAIETSTQAHRRRRRRHGPSREELQATIDHLVRARRRLAIATGVLVLVCLGLGGGLIEMRSALHETRAAAEAERHQLQAARRADASRFSAVQRELHETQERTQLLVEQRIPGLQRIAMRSPVPIDKHFVRDITFQPIKAAGRKGLEYKVVVENTSSSPIEAVLAVELFDEVGVQLATSEPAEMSGDTPPLLRAGEIRSFFAVLETGHDETRDPAYFRLVTKD